ISGRRDGFGRASDARFATDHDSSGARNALSVHLMHGSGRLRANADHSCIRRTPADAYHRAVPNRLAGETSPYLLQHADNPVDWMPWSPDALARAKLLDRPLFLSIGYA